MRLFRKRDEEAFLTHTPWAYEVGQVVQWREDYPRYRITRIVPQVPTSLLNGGVAACWSVRGVRVEGDER